MYSLLAKKGQLFAIILGLGGVIIYLFSVISGIRGAGYELSTDLNQVLKNNPEQTFDFFNPGVYLIGALIVTAAVCALGGGLWQMISAPKNSLKGILGIGLIAILFFGLYSTAGTDAGSVIGETLQKFDISDNVSKFISGSLLTTGILAGLSVVAIILGEIYNLFK